MSIPTEVLSCLKTLKGLLDFMEVTKDQGIQKANDATEALISACTKHNFSLRLLSEYGLLSSELSLMSQIMIELGCIPIQRGGPNDMNVSVDVKSVLHIASRLIEAGAPINQGSKEGWVPLHYAISSGFSELVELLVEAGANVNAVDEDQSSPLFFAMNLNQPEEITVKVMDYLVSKGADIHHQSFYRGSAEKVNLLHAAIRCSGALVITRLLEYGVALECPQTIKSHQSLLHASVYYDNVEAVKILIPLFNVNQPDALGNTPLHLAAIEKWNSMVKPLVEAGADLHLKNKQGYSVLELAGGFGFEESKAYLVATDLALQEQKMIGSVVGEVVLAQTREVDPVARSMRI